MKRRRTEEAKRIDQDSRNSTVQGGHSGGSNEAVDGSERVVDGGDDERVANPDKSGSGESCRKAERRSAGAIRVRVGG